MRRRALPVGAKEAISAACPNRIQFMSALEKRPWRRRTALPWPSSCQARSAPSEAVKRWMEGFESGIMTVIARSEATKQSRGPRKPHWIASLRSQWRA